MWEESIENKQKYLRQNILEQGLDADEFMAFCEETHGEIDLEGWPLSKLKDIVQQFASTKQETTFTQSQLDNQDWDDFQQPADEPVHQPPIQPVQQQKMHEELIFAQNPIPAPKQELVFSDLDWIVFEAPGTKKEEKPESIVSVSPASGVSPTQKAVGGAQKKEKEIEREAESPQKKQFSELKAEDVQKAVAKTRNIIETGDIRIKGIKAKELPPLPAINDIVVIETEQKTRNFLQGDYTLYHIKFNPCNHIIQRKFNDFRKLRVILHKLYPHIRLPYLEPEGWLVNSSEARDPETLNKYKYMVVEFLKYVCMRNEVLRKSKIVRIFVGMMDSNPTDFKKYENIIRPKVFSEMCVPGGDLCFPQYESLLPIDKYMTNSHLLMGEIDAHYEKLKRALETLFYNYDNVAKSLTEVAGVFDNLENVIQKFNFDNDTKKELRVFEGVKEVCMRMKETVANHHSIFKNKVQSLFRYERDNMGTIKEVNDVRNKMFGEFIKQGLHSKRPDKPFPTSMDVEGNMQIEEPARSNRNQLRVQNMFWAHSALDNMEKYWEGLRFKINEQLTLIAYDELDSENDNLNFWNCVIKKCVV